jgi:hypothetical protein
MEGEGGRPSRRAPGPAVYSRPARPTEATPLATMMINARRGGERQRALAGCSAVAARL